jgi:hypothetical protein
VRFNPYSLDGRLRRSDTVGRVRGRAATLGGRPAAIGPRRLSSVGQSDALVMRRSSVRFRQAAPHIDAGHRPLRARRHRRILVFRPQMPVTCRSHDQRSLPPPRSAVMGALALTPLRLAVVSGSLADQRANPSSAPGLATPLHRQRASRLQPRGSGRPEPGQVFGAPQGLDLLRLYASSRQTDGPWDPVLRAGPLCGPDGAA